MTTLPLTQTSSAPLAAAAAPTSAAEEQQQLVRNKRQLGEQLEPQLGDNAAEANPFFPRFKGIIQNVQISNLKGVEKIVVFFDSNNVSKPLESIGEVELVDVLEGEVSDDACRVQPCNNNGECMVTWNDFVCKCPKGYKGKHCSEKEFCQWYDCPSEASTCVSLPDGYECVTNATFNGVDSSVGYNPVNIGEDIDKTVEVTFRTNRSNGTLLHFVGSDGTYIRLKVGSDSRLVLDIPLRRSGSQTGGIDSDWIIESSSFGPVVSDGSWHRVLLRLDPQFSGGVKGQVDSGEEEQLALDETVDLGPFIQTAAQIHLGSSLVPQDSLSSSTRYDIGSQSGSVGQQLVDFVSTLPALANPEAGLAEDDFFRGCLGEVRVGGVILPFFTQDQLENSTVATKFVMNEGSSGVQEECVVCFQQECVNGGTCSDPQEKFECDCPAGFADPLCYTNIDECQWNGCVHGACVDAVNNYTCACDLGWTGWLCDLDFDECQEGPCLNGGTCSQTPQPGSFTCRCPDEYKGQTCEELKIKRCRDSPCRNGATCRDILEDPLNPHDDLYTCDCTMGYTGQNCESKKDFCEEFNQPCRNNATCTSIDTGFTYRCSCQAGYTGRNCETDIDECSSGPCLHGGRCSDLVNGYRCDCAGTGYSGAYCETNIDECATLAPCSPQSTCRDYNGTYECQCRDDDLCGKHCDQKNPCKMVVAGALCKNQGVCVVKIDGQDFCDEAPFYKCQCPDGWEGSDCSIKVISKHRREGEDEGEFSLMLVVAPVVGGMVFVSVVGLFIFISMARKKRSLHGTYSPQKQEYQAPRLELKDLMIKVPQEERLI